MVFKVNNNSNQNASNTCYSFEDKDFEVLFYQSGNLDLNFLISSSKVENVTLVIDKNDNTELYNKFDEFYQKFDKYKKRFGYDELFSNGYFSWKSDAPANEEDWDKKDVDFIYNYLNIYKEEDKYILKFINNIDKNRFVVEFNTDRSRYGSLVFPICELFYSLKELSKEENKKTLAKK